MQFAHAIANWSEQLAWQYCNIVPQYCIVLCKGTSGFTINGYVLLCHVADSKKELMKKEIEFLENKTESETLSDDDCQNASKRLRTHEKEDSTKSGNQDKNNKVCTSYPISPHISKAQRLSVDLCDFGKKTNKNLMDYRCMCL